MSEQVQDAMDVTSTGKSRLEQMRDLAYEILGNYDDQSVDSPAEAVSVILSSMMDHALAGTEQSADPERSSLEKTAVAACFMAACSVPLISWLREEKIELDAASVMHRAGDRVFGRFAPPDRETVVDSGILLFREMVSMAGENRRMSEWLSSVHNVAERYVLTGGHSDCVELIAPLYLVLLMATRQVQEV